MGSEDSFRMANKRLHNILQGKPSYVVTSVGQIGFHKCTRRGPGGEVGRDDGVMMQAAVVVTQIEPLWGKAGTPSGQQQHLWSPPPLSLYHPHPHHPRLSPPPHGHNPQLYLLLQMSISILISMHYCRGEVKRPWQTREIGFPMLAMVNVR